MSLNFLSKEIVHFFDKNKINDFPTNSSIKTFMDQPNNYGWDIKKKLLWLGQHSYLFRHSYEYYVQENGGKADIPIIDDFICQYTSAWSGLGVINVLSEILDLSEKQKDTLQNWYLRHFAYFQIETIKSPKIIAKNIINNKQYIIRAGDNSNMFEVGQICSGSLLPWNDEWYWSGKQYIFENYSKEHIEHIKKEFLKKIISNCIQVL